MRIIFMGTPEFAVPCLEMLIKNHTEYSVVCVVTKPDMPKGRTYRMTPPPVKETAEAAGIPVLQPKSVRTEDFWGVLRSYKPDLFVTAAYGKSFWKFRRWAASTSMPAFCQNTEEPRRFGTL